MSRFLPLFLFLSVPAFAAIVAGPEIPLSAPVIGEAVFDQSRPRIAVRQQLLAPHLHFYNHHRMHSALADQPPISRLTLNNVMRRDS